ncbi:MAG: nuclear transport factor 2 family protein, partial [Candidatus Latescibacteria bacterium]|nr:nuclear transport factor 2 family protein [Candidatus Latescibacterota bacterium]
VQALADETPETLLIRQALDNDKFGRRRGEVDLALSALAPQVVVYAGQRSADPRAWQVLHENLDAFKGAVEQDLRANRYEIERQVPYIHVRGKKAIVTTLDSGQVVDRASGTARPFRSECLWYFAKIEDKWLATGVVQAFGDELLVPASGGGVEEIAEVLREEEEGWEQGSAGGLAGLYDEDFIIMDAVDLLRPEKWVLLLGATEELEKWLDKRLQRTRYQLDRQVVHTYLSPGGREALVLTREQVRATYESGPVTHQLDRWVLWTLSRRSGSWKITSALYRLGLPQ